MAADVDALTGLCTGTVKWHTIAGPGPVIATNFTLSAGTNTYLITTTHMIGIDAVEITCNVLSSADVDWIVLQNGTETFAPVGDVGMTWEDVDKPFGGYHNAVTVRGYAADVGVWADGLIATLDVGGVAFYDEAAGKWEVRDGAWPNMLHQPGELAMTDACRTYDGEVLAIGGTIDVSHICNASDPDACSTMVDGRLMATSDDGGAWLPEADAYQTPGTDTPAVAANRRISPYLAVVDGELTWAKTYAAGRLLENARASTFAANHIPATEYDDGYPALVLRERGPAGSPADICALTNTGDASFEPPAPEYDVEVGWNNVVSALAWVDVVGSETLLVGYRQRDRDGAGTAAADSSLWRCDMSRGAVPECADYEFGVECYPVEEGIGIDVSDIEITESGGNVYAWVGDYGYRHSSGTCDPADASPTCAGALTDPGVWRWEVDLTDPTGVSDTVTDITGDVASETQAVTGIMVDADYLYAFRLGDRDAWYSAVPRHWRLPLADAEAGTDTWITLSEDQKAPDGELDRDGQYVLADTWADDQESLGNWASTTDGVLYNGRIVGGGLMGIWAFVGLDDAGFDGRGATVDAVDDVNDDLQITEFSMFDRADYAGATTFQGTVDNALAFAGDGRLHVAAGDLGYYRQDIGDRGMVPPQAEVFNAHGNAIATATRYMVAVPEQTAVWVANTFGVLRSADNGENFCYQTVEDQLYFQRVDGVRYVGSRYDLVLSMQDYGVSLTGFADWPACDAGTHPDIDDDGEALLGFGTPLAIEALDDNVAIAAFSAGVLAYTLDGSVTWTVVTGAPSGALTGNSRMDLIARNSEYASPTSWNLDLIFAATSGAVYRVQLDASTAPAATWTALTLSDGCPDLTSIRGVTVSPWADSFVAYGGWAEYYPAVHRGGACVSDFAGAAEATLVDPDDAYSYYAIGAVTPHPYLYNTWFVAPIILSGNPRYCAQEWWTSGSDSGWDYDWGAYYSACADPFPRMVQRQGNTIRSAPLPIAGLPSLSAITIAARIDGASVELGYGTAGSGSFRGAASW